MSVHDGEVSRLYEDLGPALLAYARSLVRDTSEAEDALQEVFVNLMTGREGALPREPRPYLFRAVRNNCLNRRRSVARELARCQAAAPLFAAPNGFEGLAIDVEQALQELPDEQREVVMLRVWAEMTIDETAQVLGIPMNTVASRHRYALARLRRRFQVHLGS